MPRTTSFQAFGTLRRFARRRDSEERCELCGSAVAPEHEHLARAGTAAPGLRLPGLRHPVQRAGRAALPARSHGAFALLPGFLLTDAQWDSLLVPINMAFFFANSATGRVTAIYPSPAGATESLLPLETWEQIARDNPVAAIHGAGCGGAAGESPGCGPRIPGEPVFPAADRPVLQAGGTGPDALARAFGRRRVVAGSGAIISRG